MPPLEVLGLPAAPAVPAGVVVGPARPLLARDRRVARHRVPRAARYLARLHAVVLRGSQIQQHLVQPLNIIVNELVLVEVRFLAVLDVIVNILLDRLDCRHLHLIIIEHPEESLQPLYVLPVFLDPGLALLRPRVRVRLAFLLLTRQSDQTFDLGLELVHLDVKRVDALVEPLHHVAALPLGRVHAGRGGQALLAVGFRLRLPLHNLEPLHLRLYQLPVLHQGGLVLDLSRGEPCFYLISQPLQLLDLLLQVLLILLLLVGVGGVVDLLPGLLELLHPLSHLL